MEYRSFFFAAIGLKRTFEEGSIAHHCADAEDFNQPHAKCLHQTGQQNGDEGCAVEQGNPKGVEEERPDNFGKQHCCGDLTHTLPVLQAKAIAEADEKGSQREAGEKCAYGEKGCADNIGDKPDKACAEGTQKNSRQSDGEEGKAHLQIPEIDGEESGQDDLHGNEHCGKYKTMR